MGDPRKKSDDTLVDLLTPVQLLHEHVTESLCQEVFQEERKTERQREWSLHALVMFWMEVIIRAPRALRQALEEARERTEKSAWPLVTTTPEAFFQRSQKLSWRFFARLFERFLGSILPKARTLFCGEFAFLRERFPEVLVLDGTKLDAIAHRLKILRDVTARVLPGGLLAVFDLFRGIPRILYFDGDAATNEAKHASGILPRIPKKSLLLGDRLYCSAKFFAALAQNGLFGLFRRNRQVSLRKKQRLSRRRVAGGVLEDFLAVAGCGLGTPAQEVRWVRFRKKSLQREVLTNVLDPVLLPPLAAIELYYQRWSIERMFYDLKEVFDLHHFYAANLNAVGMQVFAAALVYTALRIAQGMVAEQAQVIPEIISTEKFFVKAATASSRWAVIQETMHHTRKANPGVEIREPDWKKMRFATVLLSKIRVEKRNDSRRKQRFCKGRRHWTSIGMIPGGKKLIRNALG